MLFASDEESQRHDSAQTTAAVGRKSLPALRSHDIGWADQERFKAWRWTRDERSLDPVVYINVSHPIKYIELCLLQDRQTLPH
jgi:hypothetical protein